MVRNFLLLSTSIFFLFRETASFVPRKLHTQAFTTISQASARSTHLAVHDLAGKNNPSFSQKHYDSSELESQGIDNANFILSGIRSLQGSYAPNKSSTKVYNEDVVNTSEVRVRSQANKDKTRVFEDRRTKKLSLDEKRKAALLAFYVGIVGLYLAISVLCMPDSAICKK